MNDKKSQNPNGCDQSPATGHQPRAAVNRANSQHSTGPRTPEGKQRSSLNALRHGLTGHVILLPGEDLAAYEQHSKDAFDQFQPANWNEEQLVQALVDLTWKLHRLSAMEDNLLVYGTLTRETNTEDPQVHDALAMALTFRDQHQQFATFSMYRQRLSREREKTEKNLIERQAKRRTQETKDMDKAGYLLQMHKEKGEPYQPADDGFVFSNPEIETYVHRQTRLHAAKMAAGVRWWNS